MKHTNIINNVIKYCANLLKSISKVMTLTLLRSPILTMAIIQVTIERLAFVMNSKTGKTYDHPMKTA